MLAWSPQKFVTIAAVPIPPKKPYLSIKIVLDPERAEAIAAAIPDGPPPRISTSALAQISTCFCGSIK